MGRKKTGKKKQLTRGMLTLKKESEEEKGKRKPT